jgi:hypothetical protein
MVSAALVVYILGVLIGLLAMRDRFVTRLVTAALWPIGPLAGVLVVCGLLLVSFVLWPAPMAIGAALVGVAIYLIV